MKHSINITPDWYIAHPGAWIGLLEISGVENKKSVTCLETHKREIEANLREKYQGFTRSKFLEIPVMAAYDRYYNQFNKTYHVLLQLESIVLKGKNLPGVSPLVDVNFMAEVQTLTLTAAHDADRLREPVRIDVSHPGDRMVLMNGTDKEIYAGDMVMRDVQDVVCSIIYGQDNRSPISPETTHALYVSYAPIGVPSTVVEEHLHKVLAYVRLFAPGCVIEELRLVRGNS